MNALFVWVENSSKSWDTVCLVSTLEMQTEISNASGPLTAQTYSTFVSQPHGIPAATDSLSCATRYENIAPVKVIRCLRGEKAFKQISSEGGDLMRQY